MINYLEPIVIGRHLGVPRVAVRLILGVVDRLYQKHVIWKPLDSFWYAHAD